jgi:flagellar biosynthetic protein FliO
MTTRARLLTILAISLPLAACAAQPAAQAPVAQAAAPAQPAPAPAAQPAPAPAAQAAAAPAPAAQQQSPDNTPTQARRSATAPAANAPAPVTTSPATEPAAIPAPAANAPVLDPASPAAPETTVGGGAAKRPAATPAAGPVKMPSGSATGSLLQTLFALIVVLGVLGALAWFLKRYGPKAMGGNANLRVVGSLNLGGRERVLVVEVGKQWIVVGASPGRINALATMPKQDGIESGAAGDGGHATLAPQAQPANTFADWLKQTLDKRK